MKYTTLQPQDQLDLARDRLRGLESDHYRISIGSTAALVGGEKVRVEQLEQQIEAVRAEVERLEALKTTE